MSMQNTNWKIEYHTIPSEIEKEEPTTSLKWEDFDDDGNLIHASNVTL
jgi:hypothetical protein